jgi:hypothetical protein
MPVRSAVQGDEAWRWHVRFGHLHDLGAKNMVRGMPIVQLPEKFCEGCALGKMHRTPFPRASTFRAQRALIIAHGDLYGPISPATEGGGRYFLLVVDDFSRYMWLEVLKSKDKVSDSSERSKRKLSV